MLNIPSFERSSQYSNLKSSIPDLIVQRLLFKTYRQSQKSYDDSSSALRKFTKEHCTSINLNLFLLLIKICFWFQLYKLLYIIIILCWRRYSAHIFLQMHHTGVFSAHLHILLVTGGRRLHFW